MKSRFGLKKTKKTKVNPYLRPKRKYVNPMKKTIKRKKYIAKKSYKSTRNNSARSVSKKLTQLGALSNMKLKFQALKAAASGEIAALQEALFLAGQTPRNLGGGSLVANNIATEMSVNESISDSDMKKRRLDFE